MTGDQRKTKYNVHVSQMSLTQMRPTASTNRTAEHRIRQPIVADTTQSQKSATKSIAQKGHQFS